MPQFKGQSMPKLHYLIRRKYLPDALKPGLVFKLMSRRFFLPFMQMQPSLT
jgi:hypothetical protein